MDKSSNGAADCITTINRRTLGTFKPNSPIKITPETKGIEVTFSVIDKGMLVNGNSSDPKLSSFSSGLLIPAFSTF